MSIQVKVSKDSDDDDSVSNTYLPSVCPSSSTYNYWSRTVTQRLHPHSSCSARRQA